MIPAVPKPENPVFLEMPIVEIQEALKRNLSWLNHSFGVCQKLTDKNTKKVYPGVHIKKEKYQNVFPDQELGNFSFITVKDPINFKSQSKVLHSIEVDLSIIFWVDLDTIFIDKEQRNIEALKLQLFNLLSKGLYLTTGRLEVNTAYEEAKNIYNGFDIKEVDSQFLMQPYYGLRIDGKLTFTKLCENNVIFVGGTPVTFRNMAAVETMLTDMQNELTSFKNDAYDDGLNVDGGIIM